MTGLDYDVSALDLEGYLERVDVPGEGLAPDAATLRLLHRAHRLAVPFENLDLLQGRGISLALPDIQDKLVGARRGGYCYEQNLLFAAVLLSLGFEVSGLMGRTRLGSPSVRARAHMLLRVTVEGRAWLADVGCGSFGPLDPLPLIPGRPDGQGSWTYRIAEDGADLVLEVRRGDSWFGLYAFTLDEYHLVDYVVANHFNSAHPDSVFTREALVQLPGVESRITLRGSRLVEALPDGRTVEQELRDAGAVRAVLAERFGLDAGLPR